MGMGVDGTCWDLQISRSPNSLTFQPHLQPAPPRSEHILSHLTPLQPFFLSGGQRSKGILCVESWPLPSLSISEKSWGRGTSIQPVASESLAQDTLLDRQPCLQPLPHPAALGPQ